MRVCVVSSLVMMMVAVTCIPQQAEAQGWQALVPILVSKIGGLWQQDEFELLDNVCRYSVNPRIKRWQLYYRGRMWCPGWTHIRGEAETRSQSGVVGKTVTDFVTKAHKAGLITEEDARKWLSQK